MILRSAQANKRMGRAGFTMAEILVSIVILVMVVAGLVSGYVQSNKMALLCSMSLAAQSYASQGYEQARSAQWDSQMWPKTNGPGTGDELALNPSGAATNGCINYFQTNSLDVPSTGAPLWVTNFISVTNISINPPLRQIRSDTVWRFPLTGQIFTNTVIGLRAPDQ